LYSEPDSTVQREDEEKDHRRVSRIATEGAEKSGRATVRASETCQDQSLGTASEGRPYKNRRKTARGRRGGKRFWFNVGQKWRNAKQAKVATKAQDVVVGDAKMHKGMRNCPFAVQKDRRKQGVNTENIGQFSYDLLKNTLDTLW
jgi:hypothetical protein